MKCMMCENEVSKLVPYDGDHMCQECADYLETKDKYEEHLWEEMCKYQEEEYEL